MRDVRGLAIPIVLVLVIVIIGLTAVVVLGDVDESDVSDEQEHMSTAVVPAEQRTPDADATGTPEGEETPQASPTP